MDNIISWLALKSIPGVGNHLFKRLIDKFKSPDSVFEASRDDLLRVEGISNSLASAICRYKISDRLKKERDLALDKGLRIISMSDPEYPHLLLQIPDPPPYLYIAGTLGRSVNNIAVVGSRNATNYGISTTKRLCRELTSMGINIISGMALGIDTAAHQGALEGNGKTIAVLGSGMGRIYPKENLNLFNNIIETGAVITEFSIMAAPDAHNFPQRNRIISGMSLGTVVVEATKRSGSLITANLAAEQGREVFAVPGSVQSFKSMGTHSLLKQGAKLVEHAHDIMEELSHTMIPDNVSHSFSQNHLTKQKLLNKKFPPLNSEELLVVEALEPYPVHIDDITRKISMESGKLSSILLQLELKGVVSQNPGKLFSISEEK